MNLHLFVCNFRSEKWYDSTTKNQPPRIQLFYFVLKPFLLSFFQIYTDWANYYLERAKSKRKVSDLSADCRDGLLLAEVIEAVTTFKVPDLVKKPKTPQHMVSPQKRLFDFLSICYTKPTG